MSNNISKLKKGDNGVILVLAGSELYTGSAYFCSQASLSLGADLIYIITSGLTNISALKTLTPESITININIFNNYEYEFILKRITIIIFGPGLSRKINNKYYEIINWFINNNKNIILIIDGDGLFLIHKYNFNNKFENIILTPNYNEIERININISNNKWVIKKNIYDTIELNNKFIENIYEFGSPKRLGGLGDILTGILSSFLSNYKLKNISNKIEKICKLSCLFLRFISLKTYKEKSFLMITRDCLKNINIKTLNLFLIKLKSKNKYNDLIEILELIL